MTTAEAPTDRERLDGEVLALADALSEASRKLRTALSVKERLSVLLDSTLESLDAGVILIGDGGEILAVNGAARRMGAVVEKTDRRTRLDDAIALHELPCTVVRPRGAGGPVWDVRANEVELPGGGAGRVVLVQDVTRSTELEETAHRRSRLELLGRMSAEMAHEIRNPLGSLELFASMLVDDLDEMPEKRELAEQLLLGVRRLGGTVHRLLGASRGRSGRFERTDLAALCRDAAALLEPVAFSRGIALTAPGALARLEWHADAGGVRQALLNMIGNALEVTPRGGTIRVAVSRESDRATVEVADSGPGVDPSIRQRIFEPFFSTREEGTGLGLSVVERVALTHGGEAAVGDAVEGGASFRLTLGRPAAAPEGAATPPVTETMKTMRRSTP